MEIQAANEIHSRGGTVAPTVAPGIQLEGDTLIIGEQPLLDYSIRKELGRGANGVVFEAHNILLDRREALKVWIKLRAQDSRNKIEQGMTEARKAAIAAPTHSAAVYHAAIIGNYFYCTFELIDGPTLKSFLQTESLDTIYHEGSRRLNLATAYLEAIRNMFDQGLLHGDPHWANVLLTRRVEHLPIRAAPFARLVDFGASHFTKKRNIEVRHWHAVEQQIDRLFSIFPLYKETKTKVSLMFPEKKCHPFKKDFYIELMLYMMDQSLKLPDIELPACAQPTPR